MNPESDRPKIAFPTWKGILLWGVKLGVSCFFLHWAWQGLSVEEKAQLFRHWENWDYRWLGMALACGGASLAVEAFRFSWSLRIQGLRVSWKEMFPLVLSATFFHYTLTGFMGADAIRWWWMQRRFPDSKLKISIALMSDHFIGMLACSCLLGVVLIGRSGWLLENKTPLAETVFKATLWGMGIAFVGIFLLVLMMGPWVRRVFLEKLPIFPWLLKFERPVQAFDQNRQQWKRVLGAVLVSMGGLMAFNLMFWALVRMQGVDLNWLDASTLVPVVDVASSVPISLSGLGVREKLNETLFGQYTGMAPSIAVGASLMMFAVLVFWGLLGFWFRKSKGILVIDPRTKTELKD